MTREEHLEFCRRCTNRKMDLQKGIVCSLTSEIADFTGECRDYNLDETVKIVKYDDEPSQGEELRIDLPDDVFEKLRMEQNLPIAIMTGFFIGILGAALWGAVTVATNFQIGYMALAVGAGVGFGMRYMGKGVDQVFGVLGGGIAVLSCFLGNFLSIIGFIANEDGLGYFETLSMFDFAYFIPVMQETFSGMDLIFYAFAAYEGYKFSFRKFTEEELATYK